MTTLPDQFRVLTARANLTPVRQRTQFTCMAASMAMCLEALGLRDCDEDTVNNVMGAAPMRGAAWEQALATAQHYGVRATLTVPSTLVQVKGWTDRGVPVMIAWNPEGREWSHASVVFDVTPCPIHGFMVHVADSNCPDPEQTVRVVPKAEFYAKWFEKWPNYLVRRPALALEREITPDGRQVMASQQLPSEVFMSKQAKAPVPVVQKKPSTLVGQAPAQRNVVVQGLIERGTSGAGKHKNKQDYARGHARQPKHRGKGYDESMTLPVEEACGAEYMGGEACGAEYMQDHSARFEEGVPADPTKNMSEADAAEWEKQNAMHRNEFKTARVLSKGDSMRRLNELRKEHGEWTKAYYEAALQEVKAGVIAPAAVVGGGYKDGKAVAIKWLIEQMKGAKTASLLPSEAARLQDADHAPKTAARYAGDPYWLVAKYPGKDHKGRPFRKGERVFYYPKTKTVLIGEEAERAAAEFEAAAFDEDFGYRSAGLLPSEIAQIRAAKTAAHRLDGVRGHQLLPATVARKLPAIYSQESVDDPVAQVKLFSPYSGAVWYLTEYDPSSKQAFGWADLGMGGGELGYIDINELEGLNRRGLPLVERDLYWKPMPLSRAKHSRTASQQIRAKFPRGEKMTVDEVAEVVGPEFKEMNENPPPEVVAVREQMEKQARNWTPEQRLLTALGAVAEAVQHVGLLAREAKPASQNADKALKWLEGAEQILGRDVARDLSLPGYRG